VRGVARRCHEPTWLAAATRHFPAKIGIKS
jgi:hypothetical protein